MEKTFENCFYETRFNKKIDGLSYDQILQKEQEKIDSLSQEDAYNVITQDIKNMQQNNIVKATMHSAFLKALIKAVHDSEFEATICLSLSAKDGIFTYNDLENFYLKVKNISPKINFALYINSVFCEENEFESLNHLSQKYKLEIFVECSKTLEEVGKCAKENNNKTPVMLLNEYGVLDSNATLIHCNYLEESDELLIAQKGVKIVATPIYSAECGLGLVNIVSLINAGVNITVGTYTSNEFNLPKQVEILGLFQKLILKEANCLNKQDLKRLVKTEN